MDDDRKVLDLRTAARFLGIQRDTLSRLANEGRIPATRIGGRWRFHRDRLEELFEATPTQRPPA